MRFASLLRSRAAGVGALLLCCAGYARADWPPTGVRVAPEAWGRQCPFTVASDGAGGVLMVWSDAGILMRTASGTPVDSDFDFGVMGLQQ